MVGAFPPHNKKEFDNLGDWCSAYNQAAPHFFVTAQLNLTRVVSDTVVSTTHLPTQTSS